jgi:hypothetical protein
MRKIKTVWICDNCGREVDKYRKQIHVKGSRPFVHFDVCDNQECFHKLWQKAEGREDKP